MKSRTASPQTSSQAVKRLRGNSSSAPAGPTGSTGLRRPSCLMDDLPPIKMAPLSPISPSSPLASRVLSPIHHNRGAGNAHPHSRTPSREGPATDDAATHAPAPLSTPSCENSPAGWSSAVGYATTTGKSGRVIERLMSENDKLKRDLNAQVVRCQELEKSLQTYRPQIEALRQENDNLSHARGVDSGVIARRDRRIEELKADLAAERARRDAAEAMSRRCERERDDVGEQSRRELQSLTESTKHATVHAEILETSHRQLGAEYRARAEAWKRDLALVADGREQDRHRLAKLDIVADQMRQELERSKRLNADIVDTWERLRAENKQRMDSMQQRSQHENDRLHQLSSDMDKVVGDMRWLMGVKKNVQEVSTSGDQDTGTEA